MTFSTKNLTVLAYASGFTLWRYETQLKLADALAPEYFDNAGDLFRHGDRVILHCSDGVADLLVGETDGPPNPRVALATLSMSAFPTLGPRAGGSS